jgi:hypothetical protein
VLVHLYDDLLTDADTVMRSTLAFLGVDHQLPLPSVGRHNSLESLLPPRRRRIRRRQLPRLDPQLRSELTQGFADEISRLEEILDRDLSAWR